MKKTEQYALVLVLGALVFSAVYQAAPAHAARDDVGYRKLMLGQSRERVGEIVKSEFSGEFSARDDGRTIVLDKGRVDNPVAIIVLVFDNDGVLYKINVKMVKNKTNPQPDEVIKVIEKKHGPPAKKTIAGNLDLTAYWRLDGNRYEIFFQNIMAWDKFEVQYTDTLLEKRKEALDREMNKKPVDKNLDF